MYVDCEADSFVSVIIAVDAFSNRNASREEMRKLLSCCCADRNEVQRDVNGGCVFHTTGVLKNTLRGSAVVLPRNSPKECSDRSS